MLAEEGDCNAIILRHELEFLFHEALQPLSVSEHGSPHILNQMRRPRKHTNFRICQTNVIPKGRVGRCEPDTR